MRDTIVLSGSYGESLLLHAFLEGYGTLEDKDLLSFINYVKGDYLSYVSNVNMQTLLQLFILYDNIIVPGCDLPCQFTKLESVCNLEIVAKDTFLAFAGTKEDAFPQLDIEYAQYIKPTIIDCLNKNYSKLYNHREEKISANNYFSRLYDIFFGISDAAKPLKDIVDLVYKNAEFFKASMDKAEYDNFGGYANNSDGYIDDYLLLVKALMSTTVSELVWNMETCANKDAIIFGSNALIKGYRRENKLSSGYKILKIEHNKILDKLPCFDSFSEAFRFKEERKSDIRRLRNVISEIEDVLRNNGRESAVKKAENDIIKAKKELLRNSKLQKVLRWTTYFTLPVGVAEALLNSTFFGLSISSVGFLTQMVSDINVKRNNWLDLVR